MEYTVTIVDQGGFSPRPQIVDLTKPWSGYVPVATVIFNPEQPRKYFSEESLAELGASIRTGQETPNTVMPHTDAGTPHVRWMIVDGERRWRAIQAEGISFIWVCYKPGVTQKNIHTASFKANWCREGHTHFETAFAIDREIRSGKTHYEIAAMVGKSRTWAINEHALITLHPDLLALMDEPTPREKRLPINIALLMVNRSHEEQLQLWKENKTLPKKQAYHQIRFSRSSRVSASTGRARKPSDEKKYVHGKLGILVREARALNALPEQMLGVYAGVDVSELLTFTRIIAEQITEFGGRLTAFSQRNPESVPVISTNGSHNSSTLSS